MSNSPSDADEDTLQLWKSAVTEYEKDVKRVIPSQATFTKLRNVHSLPALFDQVAASGQSFEDFRNERPNLWRRLKAFATPLQAVLGLAATSSVVADAFGLPVGTVISAVTYLIKVIFVFHPVAVLTHTSLIPGRRQLQAITTKWRHLNG